MQVSSAFGGAATPALATAGRVDGNPVFPDAGVPAAPSDASMASADFASVSDGRSAALRIHYADSLTPATTDVDLVIHRIPDVERRITTIEDVEMLVESKGPYSELPVIRRVRGKWETAGPGQRARPHYDKWQADPGNRLLEEHFYDALFHDLGGIFLDLVDDTVEDWKKTGRFERQVAIRAFSQPGYDASRAERDIRDSMLAWYATGPALERYCLWKLAGDGDRHARQLVAARPEIGELAPLFMMMRWDLWHQWGQPRQHHRDPADEMRLLHKKLIIKQVLDVALARETAYIEASPPA
jgi:hypothetical protein